MNHLLYYSLKFMLLGTSPKNKDVLPESENLIIQMMMQNRYYEAFELLKKQESTQISAQYNIALCLYWISDYQQVLNHLENIQLDQNLTSKIKPGLEDAHKKLRNNKIRPMTIYNRSVKPMQRLFLI
ncbi:MAG: hypothetical protein EOO85_03195 [Pedobacter sp.]|nr:MAG: hypothetical protein EOO85_03195 [Pedobacter sp.]